MTAPRARYDPDTNNLEIEHNSSTDMNLYTWCEKYNLTVGFFQKPGKKPILTCYHLNEFGSIEFSLKSQFEHALEYNWKEFGSVELFLAQMKKPLIEHKVVPENNWAHFVTDVRHQVLATNPHEQNRALESTIHIRRNLFAEIKAEDDIVSSVNEFLDVRSLALFQQSILSGKAKDPEARAALQTIFNLTWVERCKQHYPYPPFKVLALTEHVLRYPPWTYHYPTAFLTSATTPKERRLMNEVIEGNHRTPAIDKAQWNDFLKKEFYRDGNPFNLIDIAIQYKHHNIVTFWWKKHILPFYKITGEDRFDLTKLSLSGYTIVHMAIFFHMSDLVIGFLSDVAAIHTPDRGSYLIGAVCNPNFNGIVQALLEKKADPNIILNGYSPLHLASMYDQVDNISTLIKAGANRETKTPKLRDTPLMVAAWKKKSAAMQRLLEHKVNVACRNIYGETPLHWAIANNDKKSADLLLHAQREAKLSDDTNPLLAAEMGNDHNTPFHLALIQQKEEFVRLLLQEAQQNPTVLARMLQHTNTKKESVLMLALKFSTLDIFKDILTIASAAEISLPYDKEVFDRIKRERKGELMQGLCRVWKKMGDQDELLQVFHAWKEIIFEQRSSAMFQPLAQQPSVNEEKEARWIGKIKHLF